MSMGIARLLGAAALWAASGLALAGEPSFARRDTWLESLVASREALIRQAAETRSAGEATAPKGFQPLHVEMTGKDTPRRVRIAVEGLKKLYLGSDGRRPAIFGNPVTVALELEDDPPVLAGLRERRFEDSGFVKHDGQGRDWTPVRAGDRVFARGLLIQRAEAELPLDGEAECLEMWIGVADPNDNRPVRIWADWRPAPQPSPSQEKALEALGQSLREAFPDPLSLRQMRLEEAAGIWREDWEPGKWSDLAARYAQACGPLREKALELAKACKSLADLDTVRGLFYVQHAKARLELAEKTLAFVEGAAPRPQLAAELKALQARLAAAEQGRASGTALYANACALRRKIILSHPLLDFPNLLLCKRTDRLPEHMCDQYLGRHSQAAPGLVVLENWKDAPRENLVLDGKLPKGGLIHPDLSFDGTRALFAFADHASPRNGSLRGYYIYEYSFATGEVRQITGTDRDPMEGQNGRQTVLIEDTAPCYLPDGGFAFISTRSQQYGRCHGGRYVPSYTLYRGELDGSGIRALSYNEANEWAPSVLHDGTIVYCRWDYVNRHDTIFQSLWVIRPDGTQTAHYYGNASRSPCFISEPRAIPNSRKSVATAAAHHGQTLGTLIVVDPSRGQEEGTPLTWITPEFGFPESGVPEGITTTPLPPPEDIEPQRGRAATPWPLSEDLFLCTYQHGARHAIYLVDTLGGRELIWADSATSCFDPIPLRPRPTPPALANAVAGREGRKTGAFFVQDVYQSTQPLPRGSIKRLRINEIISQPTSSVPIRSAANNEVVKGILGTVPVNDDGSAFFEAPAHTPMQFQLLDENGMAVMTMRSLVYLQPGEQASCVGCHEPRNATPPPANLAAMQLRQIEPPAGPHYQGGFGYVRTVQPVLDRYCIACHGPGKAEGNVDLTGGFATAQDDKGRRRDPSFSVSYNALLGGSGLVKIAQRNGETAYSKPKDYFAHAGRLAKLLLDGHPDKAGARRVELDRESFQRIVDWLDLNAQFYGDYSFNRIETQPPLPEGEKALREAIARRFGQELAQQPYAALVNVANPAESRILLAPLPVAAGGWGQVKDKAFRGKDDPAYQEMARLIEASVTPPKHHDIAGTCGRTDGCRCGNCWVRKDREARRAQGQQQVSAPR
ncbi:MAG TPA: hypothetical protein VNE39_06720 [Planctomycetota bacterium]|nr:hypothetical protein [Planctomycetota bacterium]